MLRLLFTIALLGGALDTLLFPVHAAEITHVALVLSEPTGAYREVANTIAARLEREGIRVSTVNDAVNVPESDLIVTIGAKATQTVADLNPSTPVLSTLIPRQLFERIPKQGDFSAVVLDQPVARQLRLVRAALPKIKKVGAILGPDSVLLAPSITAEANELGLEVAWQKVASQNELSKALEEVLSEAEILLAVPDRIVSSPDSLHNLLLTSYRHRDPVVGYSAAYGKAGALLSLYSTPEQAARQTAEMILDRGTSFSTMTWPKYFSVDVNWQVARLLGLELPDEAALMESIKP